MSPTDSIGDDLHSLIVRTDMAYAVPNDHAKNATEANEYHSVDTIATLPTWPAPLMPAAYHGLIGDIVRAVEPHTEADPVALVIQTLVAAGNAVGRNPHFMVGSDRHGLNLFTVLCGPTSSGGKGLSWSRVSHLFTLAGLGFLPNVKAGLASGEALIWQIRDPSGSGKEFDSGVSDKRLLIVEGEFASHLHIMARPRNTLSSQMRLAWDGSKLFNTVKGVPLSASNPHVSVIGHITPQELRRCIDGTELVNGFFNRFLPVMVRRSKDLPHGGEIDELIFEDLAGRLRSVLMRGMKMQRLQRSDTARKHWEILYPQLKGAGIGLVGAATSRAAAQVTRLSCIYAILDGVTAIEVSHTNAALAVWRYVTESTSYLFGGGFGDPDVEKLWMALLDSGTEGMSMTDIHRLFSNHSRPAVNALTTLQEQGYVRSEKLSTAGRPKLIWHAVQRSSVVGFDWPEEADL